MPQTRLKRPTEVRRYVFDFADFPEIDAGDTLTGTPTVTSSVSGLTIGSPTISSATVRVQISGGSAGTTYPLTCTCSTSAGWTLVMVGNLLVSTRGSL